jgi:hypothetical protein
LIEQTKIARLRPRTKEVIKVNSGFNALSILMLLICSLSASSSMAQGSVKDSIISMFSIDLSLGYHSPAGDLANRFGDNGAVGGSVHYKTNKNWLFGLEGGLIFGTMVKDPVTLPITTVDGYHIDQNGNFVNLLFLQRGLYMNVTAGKVFKLFGPNPNSGLVVTGGAGLLQHKILLETRNNEVPQLEGDYLKGYDRLTNGLSLHQFVGYRYMGNNRMVNVTLGIEGFQGFTENRRDFDFDMMRKDDKKRLDMLYGLKLMWSFPIYRRVSTGYYVN